MRFVSKALHDQIVRNKDAEIRRLKGENEVLQAESTVSDGLLSDVKAENEWLLKSIEELSDWVELQAENERLVKRAEAWKAAAEAFTNIEIEETLDDEVCIQSVSNGDWYTMWNALESARKLDEGEK